MDRNLKHKLYNYEALPPEKTWQDIEATLNTPASLHDKMYHFQESPPKEAWNKISTVLNEENNKPDVKKTYAIRRHNIFKYIAAAALLLFISLSVIWINKSSEKNTVVQKNFDQTSDTQTTKQVPSQTISPDEPNREEKQNTSVANENKKILEGNTSVRSAITKASYIRNIQPKTNFKPSVDAPKAAMIVQYDKEDKYMIYSTASGNIVRLPKKLYSLFSCATDPDISQAYWCKQNIQNLQHKVAQTSSPSTDFAAMLYIIKDLQENQ